MNLNARGGGWANRDFLPLSKLNRGEDGEYWYDRVVSRGAQVHTGGTWTEVALYRTATSAAAITIRAHASASDSAWWCRR